MSLIKVGIFDDYSNDLLDDLTKQRRQETNYWWWDIDSGDEQETKNLCDYVLDDVDQNDILFEQEPNVVSKTEQQTPFLEIMLPKDKYRRSLTKKIKKKYQTQRQKRETIKRASKKAIEELKKTPVNYDDDASIDDLSTIGYNSDTENMLTIMVVRVAQQQAKRIKNIKT